MAGRRSPAQPVWRGIRSVGRSGPLWTFGNRAGWHPGFPVWTTGSARRVVDILPYPPTVWVKRLASVSGTVDHADALCTPPRTGSPRLSGTDGDGLHWIVF